MLEPLFPWAESIGLRMDETARTGFENFATDLYIYNEGKNLTRVPPEDAWHRHFADSLLFQDLFPQGAKVADLGTGPGLPAWPLARARPDLKVTAVDSNGKMLDFLRRHTLPNLTIVQVRAEEWPMRERFDVVTGRAVAPLAAQLELSAPLCRIGGKVLSLRTPNDDPQSVPYDRLGLRLESLEDRAIPTGELRRCLVFLKSGRTDPIYPRRWAEIKARPLAL
ncbi:16S rRNA (guanine(527)-N(7))-methyltransferase RsmG [soil metagenome]